MTPPAPVPADPARIDPARIHPARILDARMAVEALRAGVPSRAAIRRMGMEQGAIEHAFDAALASVWAAPGSARPGIGLAGGFGSGKSHMLGYLSEVAYAQGFVVSRVVASKETRPKPRWRRPASPTSSARCCTTACCR